MKTNSTHVTVFVEKTDIESLINLLNFSREQYQYVEAEYNDQEEVTTMFRMIDDLERQLLAHVHHESDGSK